MDCDTRYILFVIIIILVFGGLSALFNAITMFLWLFVLFIMIAVTFFKRDLIFSGVRFFFESAFKRKRY